MITNAEIASGLDRIAELLQMQGANPFPIQAYRAAAQTLHDLQIPASSILEAKGVEGLRLLPHIGASLARTIEQLVDSGKVNLLEHLLGESGPEQILATVPGLGPVLANRLHEQLGIETLAELEAAAYDGRLARVPGFGLNRVRGVRESLAGRFQRGAQLARPQPKVNQPPIRELLEVDREYRQKAQAGRLPRIAPRRFNPTGEAWLPVLHTQCGHNHYTALFSNTAHAHELGTTKDWVVIYRDDEDGAGQWTVVTARLGRLKGKRLVRGRETECQAHYNAPPR